MAVCLEDENGNELKINAWNWGVFCHYSQNTRIDEEALVALRAGYLEVDGEYLDELGLLAEALMQKIGEGNRLKLDGTITAEPDDGTFHREKLEENYSLTYTCALGLRDFLTGAHQVSIS